MKYIAMFLPQFHECKYNSNWWGKGFTEWNNVRQAKPLFNGHNQPRIPLNGEYVLNNVVEISRQAQQAHEYGIDAFSIYHYWYEGERPLSGPLDIILNNRDIDINFSLCWANHSWTRSWKNRSGALDVLIEQTYEKTRVERSSHFHFLCNIFMDSRYTKINKKPLFQIYMPEAIPACESYINELREYAMSVFGIEIYITAMLKNWRSHLGYLEVFDAVTLFQPSLSLFSPENVFSDGIKLSPRNLEFRLRNASPWAIKIMYNLYDMIPDKYSTYPYEQTWNKLIEQYRRSLVESPLPVFPSAFVNFDNTPRYKKRAKLFTDFSVEVFERKLLTLSQIASENSLDQIVFINAWNEWGEGMFLEPDATDGYKRLEAVRNCKKYFKNNNSDNSAQDNL